MRLTVFRTLQALACMAIFSAATPSFAGEDNRLQATSLLGKKLYSSPDTNSTGDENLARALVAAKADYEDNLTVDTATWYGRTLSYKGRFQEAIAVYDRGLKKFPKSAKLLRHRAHRYFSTRQFDRSIRDGLKAARLYEGKPLEREKFGPDYFRSTDDIVQFFLYYHLGQAYYATHDFSEAAKWFGQCHEISQAIHHVEYITACVNWEYSALARAGRNLEAQALLDRYDYTLFDLTNPYEYPFYFDAIQMYKGHRNPQSLISDEDKGMPFSSGKASIATGGYPVAVWYMIQGRMPEAKSYLKRILQSDSWSYFGHIQAESDWYHFFPDENPYDTETP